MMPLYTGTAADHFLRELAQPILPIGDDTESPIEARVRAIIQRIAVGGDTALADVCAELGDEPPQQWAGTDTHIHTLAQQVSPVMQTVIGRAAARIQRFGQAIVTACAIDVNVADAEIHSGLRWQPVARVACYVPGGRYPLPSTALMTAVTAAVAGVPEIVILSPKVGPEVAFAAQWVAQNTKSQVAVARLGGAHGVAVLALGTAQFAKVDMVVGPGNAYVAEAKRQLQGVAVGIDMLAGPSEVAIIADAGADPVQVAVDLLAQAEHDPDARVYLLTDHQPLAAAVIEALPVQCKTLGVAEFVVEALRHSSAMVLPDLAACCNAANQLAPEHLELQVAQPEALLPQLQHYGALFVGYGTPVPIGDYMAGPNHTLPTARSARFSGGLTPMTFLRPQTWLKVQPGATQIYDDAATFAAAEGLVAHEGASRLRL